MANVEQTLATAYNHINDWDQTLFTKESLINFLRDAHRELQVELTLNGIPVVKKKSAVFTIPAIPNLATWTGEVTIPNPPGQPNDIIEPLECWERPTSSTFGVEWDPMIQKSWVPENQPTNDLVYWNWIGETIKFLGALQSNDIKLYYSGGIPLPLKDLDPIGMIFGELFIAPRLAAFALRSIGGKQGYADLSALANGRLDKILAMNINAEQALPVRRRPYRHGRVPFVIR